MSQNGRRTRFSVPLALCPARLIEAPVLERFESHRANTHCPYAVRAVLVGAPDWDPLKDDETNIQAQKTAVVEFTAISRQLKLDGIVVPLSPRAAEGFDPFVKAVNSTLGVFADRSASYGDRPVWADIESPAWRYTIRGQQFFVSATAGFYGPTHSRYSGPNGEAFLLLQPMHTFDITGPLTSTRNARIKREIRGRFEDAGCSYDVRLVTQPIEALRYVKPLTVGAEGIRWWS